MKCMICHKELPEEARVPLCEYHLGWIQENGKKAAGAVASAAVLIKTVAPKVMPIVREKAPEVIKAAKAVAKTVSHK